MEIPSPEHYVREEREWMSHRRWDMGLEYKHPISSDELKRDFMDNHCYDGFSLEEKFRIFYANEYIVKNLLQGTSPEKHIAWIYFRLKDLCELLNNHNLLKEKIAA